MTEVWTDQTVDEAFLADFFARWEQAWSSGDPTAVAELLTDDVIFQSSDVPGTLHGRPEALGYLNMLFRTFPDQRLEVLEFYRTADGLGAADRVHWGGTMLGPFEPPGYAPTGRWVEMTAFGGFRFREGRVSWFQAVFDMLDIGRQIGAVPPQGSMADRMGVRMQHRAAKKLRRDRRKG
jgi:predicted ester cyclase